MFTEPISQYGPVYQPLNGSAGHQVEQFGAVMAYSGRVAEILSVWVLLIFFPFFFLGWGYH